MIKITGSGVKHLPTTKRVKRVKRVTDLTRHHEESEVLAEFLLRVTMTRRWELGRHWREFAGLAFRRLAFGLVLQLRGGCR